MEALQFAQCFHNRAISISMLAVKSRLNSCLKPVGLYRPTGAPHQPDRDEVVIKEVHLHHPKAL